MCLPGGSASAVLGLTLAEMQDLVGRGERRVELDLGEIRVDQEMVMPRVVEFDARRCDPHALQAELDGHGSVDGLAVARSDEVNLGARRAPDERVCASAAALARAVAASAAIQRFIVISSW